MKKTINLLIIISLGLFMNSCYYDSYPIYDDVDDGGGELPTDPDDPNYIEVKYGADIKPIWNSNCISCHTSFSPILKDNVSYSNLVPKYVIAENADTSPLVLKLNETHVGRVGKAQMSLIKAWIDQGAKNN